jgi:hypothetical protein
MTQIYEKNLRYPNLPQIFNFIYDLTASSILKVFTRKFPRKPTAFGRGMNIENKLKINEKILVKISNFWVLLDSSIL